jgi:putative DNA primase/helicase
VGEKQTDPNHAEDLASPVSAFVRDCCETGADCEVPVDDLWGAWGSWCEDNGQPKGTKQTFGRNLRAARPQIRVSRPREGDERHRVYAGIALKGLQ